MRAAPGDLFACGSHHFHRRPIGIEPQVGQVFELTSSGASGDPLWAYRYRLGGRASRRVQQGGFASEQGAREALESWSSKLR